MAPNDRGFSIFAPNSAMQSKAATIDEYMESLPEDRKEPMNKLRKTLLKNLPKGFKECMSYGMIGYVVPLSTYPAGYHCDPSLPLSFINIASQKKFHRPVPHGYLWRSQLAKMVYRRIPQTQQKETGYGQELHPL